MRRGATYFVNLNPIEGRETAGRRPVLVVSSDAINKQPLAVTVVVGTNGKNVARDYPVNVRVPAHEGGLPDETVFMCFQLRSLDPGRFANPATGRAVPTGTLPAERMNEVATALQLVLEIRSSGPRLDAQRSRTGCIGGQKCEVIFARALIPAPS